MQPRKITTTGFPALDLPITPPLPPMEAKRVTSVPSSGGWQFEPKWDGFRAIVFRKNDDVVLQSKAGQPLARYFPELVDAFRSVKAKDFVLDGEIVIPRSGRLSFDDLLLRIHPAESRVRKLAASTPANYFAFDLLALKGKDLTKLPIEERRERLETFFGPIGEGFIRLSPATTDRQVALEWFNKLGTVGLDGVMAKRLGEPYHSGDREGMVKVKHLKTADCVVGGFRYGEGTKVIGALFLGLYDDEGRLVYVGHSSSVKKSDKLELTRRLESMRSDNPFEVRSPGGPSRWAQSKTSTEWVPIRPELVCEVEYDYFSQGRFRHGSKVLRWRPEKKPKQCTMEQVLAAPARGKSVKSILGR